MDKTDHERVMDAFTPPTERDLFDAATKTAQPTVHLGAGAAVFDTTPADQELALKVAHELGKTYPGHPWAVAVDRNAGVVQILHTALSDKYGFLIKLADIEKTHDGLARACIWAGGEMLERYGVNRKRADREQLAEKSIRAPFV